MAIAERVLEDLIVAEAASQAFVLQLIDGNSSISLDDILARPAWQRDAACIGLDADIFFPPRGGNVVAARAVCAGCLVVDECRAWALAQGQELKGFWGGLSEQERRQRREAGERVTVGRIVRQWEPEHGTITRYRHHGCRCAACKAAKAEERARAG